MFPIVKMLNVPQEPTHGQLDDGTTAMLSEDQRPDDGMLHVGHGRDGVSSEKGQGKLMGSICCTRIPFFIITTGQSHCLLLSLLYSANPPVDLKTHTSTGTVELFFVMILMTSYAYKLMFYV